jgi:two-component system chemotaxis response regulator CheB
MSVQKIVVIGGSAGGFEALISLVSQFTVPFPAAILVVLHLSPDYPSQLPNLLGRKSALAVTYARHGEELKQEHIYVAPPDQHVILEDGIIRLSHGPKENHARPAIDPLFRTAAENYRSHAIGVILSGALNDGTAGMIAIKRHGGIAIVQDPQEARFTSMPFSAINQEHPDYILSLSDIAPTLNRLVGDGAASQEGGKSYVHTP